VVTVNLPPLRERKGDIPALVESFIDRHGGEEGVVTGMTPDALERLNTYNWPGNVRELENCIQHALALAPGPEIQVSDLPPSVVYGTGNDSEADQTVTSLQQVERRAILKALEETGGDRLRAAKLLGIGKTTIYRKLKEYGLDDATDVP